MSQSSSQFPVLEARSLTLAYQKFPILQDLDLSIMSGQITTLIGQNGCGKSTLLSGLSRLLAPKQGSVYLDGTSIHTLSTRTVAKQLGILPQSPPHPEGISVKSLVTLGRYPRQNWLQAWSEEDEEMVNRALVITRMRDLGDRPLDSLSGGQKQRAWIAMALAQDTPILLLDEPTTYLDMAHQIEVLDLLHDLNRNCDRTIVMVLHDLNLACRYSDTIVALKNGKILAQGHPKDIIDATSIEKVFDIQCTILNDPTTNMPLCIPRSQTLTLAGTSQSQKEI
ncbi:ABC transporter ATP-binding protein [Synechococcus sp. PCC 7336]|uniref:ABC transporter ATP-binding protein n=1 Tax=Synechococcus sp. PCC 7336 TaxID=195250 RepID=UPI0003483937|nr:ABC transporter ATP-binding protein [Synechococcus sp. PCC 7336]